MNREITVQWIELVSDFIFPGAVGTDLLGSARSPLKATHKACVVSTKGAGSTGEKGKSGRSTSQAAEGSKNTSPLIEGI